MTDQGAGLRPDPTARGEPAPRVGAFAGAPVRVDPLGLPVSPGASVWNVANALTALRVGLVPVFGLLLLRGGGSGPGQRVAAAVVFVVAVLTDRLDGELARRHGLVTDLGKIADPIADKALVGTALVGLSLLHELAWWVTLVVLAREIVVTLLRFVVIRHGVMPAGRGGKAKTVVQAVAISLYLLRLPGPGHRLGQVVMAGAVVLTVVTGVEYLAQAYRLVAGSPRTLSRRAARAARAAAGPAAGRDGAA